MDRCRISLCLCLHLALIFVAPAVAEQEKPQEIKESFQSELSQFVTKSNQSNTASIDVKSVYVVPPPGEHRAVGEHKCPLQQSDKDLLLEVAKNFFLGKSFDVIFDKGDVQFNAIVALGKSTDDNSYVSYVVTTDIVTSDIQYGPCRVLVRANCIVGPIIDGRRNLDKGRIVNDNVTMELMNNYRTVVLDMEKRVIQGRSTNFGRRLLFR